MEKSMTDEKKRGWGLIILIPLMIFGAALQLFLYLYNIITSGRTVPTLSAGQSVLYMLISICYIIFLVAAWQWKKWGCFGYIALGIFTTVITILIEGFQSSLAIGSIIVSFFAYAVYKSKEAYFE